MKTHIVQQTKHQLRSNIFRHVNFLITRNWIGPLNDETKLRVDVQQKLKSFKFLKTIHLKLKSIRYKLTALSIIMHSIVN